MTKDSKSSRMISVRVRTAKRRSASSNAWLKRQLNDPYVRKAKEDGYRSRAAYKLKEINDVLNILKKKCRVVDLGSSPGGWTQVILGLVNTKHPESQVISLDILPMDPLPGALFLQMDFTSEEAIDTLLRHLSGSADIVLSDMAPPSSGHQQTDHLRIVALAELALECALKILGPGGTFVAKVWQGGSSQDLLKTLKHHFKKIRHIKPPSSRKESAEIYVVAQQFKGIREP